MENKELGKLGEQLAAAYLAAKGFKIIKKNYFYDKAEVDLVALHDGKIVFVEVKTRESDFLTDPLQLISIGKQKQIIKASDGYLKENDIDLEARFDIVIVVTNAKYTKYTHIDDAFYPTM